MLLPPEIWGQIFSHLVPHERPSKSDTASYEALGALCIASRDLSRVAQPLFYHTIFVPERRPQSGLKLLRTLLVRPDLARCVRNLTLSDPTRPEEALPGREQLFREITSSSTIPSGFKKLLEATTPEASDTIALANFLPLALALTSQVQQVEITVYSLPKCLPGLLGGSVRTKSGSDKATGRAGLMLPQLSNLLVSIEVSLLATSIAECEDILVHPGLQTLRLDNVDWRLEEIDKMQWSGRITHLHTLSLQHSLVDADSLRNIFARFPMLRCLNICIASPHAAYDFELHGYHSAPPWIFNSGQFGAVLREHGKNLTELTLRTGFHRIDLFDFGVIQNQSVLGSLKGLKSLRKLEIDVSEAMFEIAVFENDRHEWLQALTDTLPPDLEELVIPSDHGAHLTQVLSLIKGDYVPSLRRVSLILTCECYWELPYIQHDEIPDWTFFEGKVSTGKRTSIQSVTFVKDSN